MSKLFFTACLAMIMATCAQAQYFQSLYSDNSSGDNGMITRSTGTGHLIGGHNRQGLGMYGLMVVRTDPDGAFSSPSDFNNTYMLQTTAGDPLDFNAGHVVEFSDGTGYGIMGSYSYTDPSAPNGRTLGLAWIRLDLSGKVTAVMGYKPTVTHYSLDLESVYESTLRPGEILATAHFVGNSEASYLIALCIDQNGVRLWGFTYDFFTSHTSFETPRDIIESPYGNHEVYIVGDIYYPGGTPPYPYGNAFILTLDRNSGSPLAMQEYAGGPLQVLSAISVSNDPAAPGFILCGYTYDYHLGNTWVLKTDQSLNVQWSKLYSENTGLPEDIEAYDVIGRLNTSGNYEYYVTGRKEQFLYDATIIKLDNTGTPVNPGALFVYSASSTVSQWGNRVDINTSGTADGVSIYGIWDDPYASSVARRSFIIKAYFNGQSGCNENFTDIFDSPFPVTTTPQLTLATSLVDVTLQHVLTFTDNDINLCYNLTLPGGSNAFQVSVPSVDNSKTGALLFPNPFNSEDKILNVQLQSNATGSVNITIIDALGREVCRKQHQADAGTVQLDVSRLALGKGIYQLIVEQSTVKEVIKLIVN